MNIKDRVQYFFREHARRVRLPVSEVGVLYLLSAIVTVLAFLLAVWLLVQIVFFSDRSGELPPDLVFEDREQTETVLDTCAMRSPLNGVCLDNAENKDESYIAVMVENSTDAWPLSGVSKARVVYEAPVEGDIPRFMLLFEKRDAVEKVGPVRSARPYFLDWLREYPGAMYMHVGGSPEALAQIESSDVFNLNEFFRSWYYWRSTDRGAPHNVYTSSELWQKAWKDYEGNQQPIEGWKFAEQTNCDGEQEKCVSLIVAEFALGRYSSRWEYTSSTQTYTRYQGLSEQFDKEGTKVEADVVIVQKVESEIIDAVGRKRLDIVGAGDAQIFQAGRHIAARWQKDNVNSRTKWYDHSGKEITLQPGTIWIEVLPNGRGLQWQ